MQEITIFELKLDKEEDLLSDVISFVQCPLVYYKLRSPLAALVTISLFSFKFSIIIGLCITYIF